jgi:hypothetical protein
MVACNFLVALENAAELGLGDDIFQPMEGLTPVRCSTVSTITFGGAERFCSTIRLVAGSRIAS